MNSNAFTIPSAPSPQTIAVLSASIGAGHIRAAEALVAAAAVHPRLPRLVHLDVIKAGSPVFKSLYADGYFHLANRFPRLWGALYRNADRPGQDSAAKRLIRSCERYGLRRLSRWLDDLNPDQVICTHFLPAQYLSAMIAAGRWKRPVWVMLTDFDCHSFWLLPHMSGYFVASDEVAWQVREKGLQCPRIEVHGIPVAPVFSQGLDKSACAAELGLDSRRPIALLMTGGTGLDSSAVIAERLLRLPGDVQIVAVAGRNERLLERLQGLAGRYPGRLTALGFTTIIHKVMAASDLAVIKPGGLTTSECLALGLPMVLVSPIPGQEERNATYLLEHGAALSACDMNGLAYRVQKLLGDPSRLASLRSAAARISRPHAAHTILDSLLEKDQILPDKPLALDLPAGGMGRPFSTTRRVR